MYYAIEGDLIEKEMDYIILKVGQIFYELKISTNTYLLLKDKIHIKLYTHLLVKEDKLYLYGFFELVERNFFLMLLQVSGISTALALTLLSSLQIPDIYKAILDENTKVFGQVKGIGVKTAKRIILDLKDKVEKIAPPASSDTLKSPHQEEAVLGLIKLGIDAKKARKNIQNVLEKHGNTLSLEEIVKYALHQ